jgi:hypothetical protein
LKKFKVLKPETDEIQDNITAKNFICWAEKYSADYVEKDCKEISDFQVKEKTDFRLIAVLP